MAPTSTGWHCAACQTEVVDFTRLSEAEVLAYLAQRQGQRVCAAMQAPLVPQHYQRPRGPRRWLLAAAALLGWQSVGALPPQLPPGRPAFFKSVTNQAHITICGVVLDDSLHIPIRGAKVFIKGTKYGAVTNAQGEFSFSFATDWKLAEKGEFLLEISADAFTFESQLVAVKFKNQLTPAPLTVRLLSLPGRGNIMGRVRLVSPPVPPPGPGKN